MSGRGDVATRLTTAVGVPIRLRLLGALSAGGRLTLPELAQRLGAQPEELARHLHQLEMLDLVVRCDGDRRRYALCNETWIYDEEYGALPVEARRAIAAQTLTQFHAGAAAAVGAGGFDRHDVHMSSVFLDVDEEGWHEVVRLMRGTFEALMEMAAQPAENPVRRAAVIQLHYADEPPAPAQDEEEPFDEVEGRAHAVDLVEALQQAVTVPGTPWHEVVALADRLRVVARAAALARPEE